jgi:hypothetical protein
MIIPNGASFIQVGKPLKVDDVCVLIRHMIAGYVEITDNHKPVYHDNGDFIRSDPYRIDLTLFPEETRNLFREAVNDKSNVEDWFNLYWRMFPFGNDFCELSHLPRLLVLHVHSYTRMLMASIGRDIWINSNETDA